MRKLMRNGLSLPRGKVAPALPVLLVLGAMLAEPALAARRTATLHVGMRIPHETALPSSARQAPSRLPAGAAAPERIVVKEGDTLTSLATRHYGTPSAYVHILDANRDTIRDPDRILPGSLLILPQVVHCPGY